MTIFYPDIAYPWQAGIDLSGATAVCCKATEGSGYTNPDYRLWKDQAAEHGVFFFAYHFLYENSIETVESQAAHAFSVVGKDTGLMVDVELEDNAGGTGRTSAPTLADVILFVEAYRKLGGVCYFVYLPEWYWSGYLGAVSLDPLISLHMLLVSSNFTTYSASGPGWRPYGGMTPTVWQYSETTHFGGVTTDFNAYRSSLADLKSLVTTGALPTPAPAPTPMEEDVVIPAGPGPDVGVAFNGAPYKTISFLADPGRLSVTQTQVRVAMHFANSSPPAWRPAIVTITPTAPYQVLDLPEGVDGVSFVRMDDVALDLVPAFG